MRSNARPLEPSPRPVCVRMPSQRQARPSRQRVRCRATSSARPAPGRRSRCAPRSPRSAPRRRAKAGLRGRAAAARGGDADPRTGRRHGRIANPRLDPNLAWGEPDAAADEWARAWLAEIATARYFLARFSPGRAGPALEFRLGGRLAVDAELEAPIVEWHSLATLLAATGRPAGSFVNKLDPDAAFPAAASVQICCPDLGKRRNRSGSTSNMAAAPRDRSR
jgi:hypothetical protein